MFVEGPGDDSGFVANLPASYGRRQTVVPASFYYGNAAPDMETLAEQSGARDYQPCGHPETSARHDGCSACRYETWLAAARQTAS